MELLIVLGVILGIWALPYVLRVTDPEEGPPGRHRGRGRGRWIYWHTRRGRSMSASVLCEWLRAERQSVMPITFNEWFNERQWKEYEEWQTVRMAAGGW